MQPQTSNTGWSDAAARLIAGDTGQGKTSYPLGQHLLITGDPAAASADLMHAARQHLADGGRLWVFASAEAAVQAWMEQVKIMDWLVTPSQHPNDGLDALADQVYSAVRVINSRTVGTRPADVWQPVMLVLDALLPEHLSAATPLAADLASILSTGSLTNVWLAAATPSLDQLPEHLRQAAEANAAITQDGPDPQPA
jgi:hypothetical protein